MRKTNGLVKKKIRHARRGALGQAQEREREEGWGGTKDEARPGAAGINSPGPKKNEGRMAD